MTPSRTARRTTAALLSIPVLAFALGACSQVDGAARGAASDAASSASQGVRDAASSASQGVRDATTDAASSASQGVRDAATDAASSASQGVRDAATDAASSASQGVRDAATDEAVTQLCRQTTGSGPLADGQLSVTERATVVSLASVASSAGLPEQYAAPLKKVAESTDDAKVAQGVEALKTACADRSATSSG